jgi:hypothetical protein
MDAMIRWIDESNADSLGYPVTDEYAEGVWVLETHNEWEADLADIPQTRVDAAQREAEAVLGSAPAFWEEVRAGNYGTAYVTEIEDR